MSGPLKRGEGRARSLLRHLREGGIEPRAVRSEGRWALHLIKPDEPTPAQLKLLADAVWFAIAYPRCFGTAARLLREQEGTI